MDAEDLDELRLRFGVEITAALDDKGFGARSELARVVGVTPSGVQRWSRGIGLPQPDLWPAIEEFFGWPKGYIDQTYSNAATNRIAPRQIDRIANRDAIRFLIRKVDELEGRLAELEDRLGPPSSMARAADTGSEDAQVVEDLGTSRRRVQPVSEGE